MCLSYFCGYIQLPMAFNRIPLKPVLSILLLSFPFLLHAQLDRTSVQPLLQKHIRILASDSFGGREPGTPGEVLAMNYIRAEFVAIGLEPKGSEGYFQPFKFTKSVRAGDACKLRIGRRALTSGTEFHPLAYSANASASGKSVRVGYGITATTMGHDDYKDLKGLQGKIFLIDASTPDKAGPHSRFAPVADLRTRIDSAIAKGAAGIVFYSTDSTLKVPELSNRIRVSPSTVPVLYLHAEHNGLLNEEGTLIDMQAEIVSDEATAHNVMGYLDNKASTTIVIGAHYDHLGHGGEESLYRGEPAVHNGADDNASGVAGVIELARYLKSKGPKSNNYLFMAFSGEEKGLLGSAHFTRNSTLNLQSVNYMLNMDMIGRLKTEEPVLLVNGVGTSDAWKITMEYIKPSSFTVKTTESGIGPSDHTSFYLKDIPALHFFSGTHNDYHKPSDDEELINYKGELDILDYMITLMGSLDDKGKIAFTRTKEENNENTPRFKVTLGVIPDYGFEGEGMRIDGVSDGKPASKAGLKAGDVVRQIGPVKVTDMMSYMKALGQFSKGEKAQVGILRGKEEMQVEVEF